MNLYDVETIVQSKPWITGKKRIPHQVAYDFIRNSAWWLTHPSGPVRAPGHAKNIYMSQHGWTIEFGANNFLIEKAIKRCCREIHIFLLNMDQGKEVSKHELKKKLQLHIRGAVSNYEDDEYMSYWPLEENDMKFGAQSIDIKDAVNYIVRVTGISQYVI